MTTQALPAVLSLTEAAKRLNMKPPNVAKFLARRGVEPAIAKAQGYFWWETDIERVKEEREADAERMAADRRRRRGALRGQLQTRLGPHQQALLVRLLNRPVSPVDNAERLALRRLKERGLVESSRIGQTYYKLTPAGRKLAAELS